MKLIVGLGNPGSQYENTRHNAGFIAIDNFAKKHNLEFSLEPKLKGALAKTQINGEKVFLLKPMTYMNLSGESVIAVLNYYKIEVDDMIIISDDLSPKDMLGALADLLNRTKEGEVDEVQAGKEATIIANFLKAYEQTALKEKVDAIESVLQPR